MLHVLGFLATMGSLRHTVSVNHIALAAQQPAEAVRTPAQLSQIDCGLCTLSFESGGIALPGLACLKIRMRQTPSRFPAAEQRFLSALEKVLESGIDFVLTYDCRRCSTKYVETPFAKSLIKFCEAHATQWSRRLKAVAVMVLDNIFVAAMDGIISNFLAACVVSCPLVLCHGKAEASDFFKASIGGKVQGLSSNNLDAEHKNFTNFVSIVDVHKAPQEAKDKGSSGSPDQCLACLSTSLKQKCTGSRPNVISCARAAQTFHMLPNGDVRVVQSPDQDVIVGAVVDAAQQVIENSISSLSSFKSNEFGCELNNMTASAALKFDCSSEKLEKLIGVHFHLGELIVDTEMESVSRRCARAAERAKVDESSTTKNYHNACFQGVRMLFSLWKEIWDD